MLQSISTFESSERRILLVSPLPTGKYVIEGSLIDLLLHPLTLLVAILAGYCQNIKVGSVLPTTPGEFRETWEWPPATARLQDPYRQGGLVGPPSREVLGWDRRSVRLLSLPASRCTRHDWS